MIRDPDPRLDAIDDVIPRIVVEPDTPEAVASALRWASEQRLSVVIRGGGTKLDWGRRPGRVDVMLGMRRLNRVLAHQHGDLTATIEAGAPLADVNRVLAGRGQRLPLDPAFADRATIGGIVATNDSGPLRQRHGTPRDLVIGIRVVTADGALAKAGGQVVKNVAGYDLSKLMSGSFGSLAAIVSVTFKLVPLAPSSRTVMGAAPGAAALARMIRAVMASQLEPSAFEAHVLVPRDRGAPLPQCRVAIQFASVAAAVEAQSEQARTLLAPHAQSLEILDGERERQAWRDHAERLWSAPGAIVRASWLPANVEQAVGALGRLAEVANVELIGRAGIAAGLIRVDADATTGARAIEQLRRGTAFGNVVLLRGGPALKALVDVWGPAGDRAALDASLKRALDPHDVLNAGRGPV